ncbi:glycosyltransferase [bacterium]|nr:glycosyltransferase [bacterium]
MSKISRENIAKRKEAAPLFVVTYTYPPWAGPQGVVASKLTKYLLKSGWTPIVLTSFPKIERGPINPLEIPEELVHREPSWECWEEEKPILKFTGKIFSKIPGGVLLFRGLIYRYDWQWRKKIVRKGMELAERCKPSIILASCGLAPEGLLAAMELSQKLHIPWIAHMRDPWAKTRDGGKLFSFLLQRFKEKIERRVLSNASAIITASEEFDFCVDRNKKPIYVIYHGYDPEAYPQNVSLLPQFTITYCGSLLGMPIAPLFRAIAKLKEENYTKRYPLKLRFFTLEEERKQIEATAKGFSLSDIVEALPFVPHKEVMERMCESTLLLALRNLPKFYTHLGTKFPEYMGAKRPILLLSTRDSLSARMVSSLRAGFVCENEEDIYLFLKKALADFYLRGDIEWEPDWEGIESFSWEKLARKFGEILGMYARRE